MPPHKIMIIRHAEKPLEGVPGLGVDAQGETDLHSLTVRGWQRAGALARFFAAPSQDMVHAPSRVVNHAPSQDTFHAPSRDMLHAPSRDAIQRPDIIYATGIGPENSSRRCIETAAPLAAKLGCEFITKFPKEDSAAAMADAARRTGTVLMVWEHKMISSLVAALPQAPAVPAQWPECYDLIWVLARSAAGWSFTQLPQCLLAGDSPD